jgi:O-methyltransferase involved in polyketide biosynthesis
MTYKTTKEEQEWEAAVMECAWVDHMAKITRAEYFVERTTKANMEEWRKKAQKALRVKRAARKKMLDKFLKQFTNKGDKT